MEGQACCLRAVTSRNSHRNFGSMLSTLVVFHLCPLGLYFQIVNVLINPGYWPRTRLSPYPKKVQWNQKDVKIIHCCRKSNEAGETAASVEESFSFVFSSKSVNVLTQLLLVRSMDLLKPHVNTSYLHPQHPVKPPYCPKHRSSVAKEWKTLSAWNQQLKHVDHTEEPQKTQTSVLDRNRFTIYFETKLKTADFIHLSRPNLHPQPLSSIIICSQTRLETRGCVSTIGQIHHTHTHTHSYSQ